MKTDVPRCVNCLHWNQARHAPGQGTCTAADGNPIQGRMRICSGSMGSMAVARGVGAGLFLETNAEFGCIQFEAK